MGAKRKVDTKLYAKIKKELNTPQDDEKVMKKYNLCHFLIRSIRLSWCYDDYLARTTKGHIVDDEPRKKLTTQEKTFIAWYIFIGLAVFGALTVGYLIIRWILSWFGA